MASHVQKVAILLLAAGAAPAASFSHRVHLNLKLTCVTCHVSAPASTRVEDNNLPNISVCGSCHKPGTVSIKQPRPAVIAKFSHKQHAAMGNVSPVLLAAIKSGAYLGKIGEDLPKHLETKERCEACHRGLHESDGVGTSAFPAMADCLVCHNDVDPPFSCWTCHSEKAQLTPPSHDAKWLDFHSSGKANLDRASCALCHGRNFTCRGCHVASR